MTTGFDLPPLFQPHPNLADRINENIVQSEIEGGVYLNHLEPGTVLHVRTLNHDYTILVKGWDQAVISGHPVFCPEPAPVTIHGSTWGGSMLKARYIGRGMHLEFVLPDYEPIRTSRIVEVSAAA
jgi:hypothetical protein